ncbi:hypothetical protein [Anaerophaga thermohalophila]|jgi:hypothetical protein|uniref:hypothetical protein n=1 Tax=Anaerophaga thermohalophila TaxID=177400 RepID=UPI000237C815|nr:hypothetical protein [Anaerophaga thermohalophila]
MEALTVKNEAMTAQEGLNQVVINKVQNMIERNRMNVENTMQRLISEQKMAQDFIVPIGARNQNTAPAMTFAGEEKLLVNLPSGEFSLHDNATGQLAEKMGVPVRYLKGLSKGSDWERKLAATVLNEHSLNSHKNRVLVRSVGNEVRAVLSDSYRRINSSVILMAFMQEALQQGALMADAYMSDTKVWAETILPTPITVPTKQNGDVVIFMGARFSTSDYGDGAVDMRSFMLNGACLNGMVRESVMKQVHLGAKLPDNLALSERTYELDTQTTVSAVNDLTRGLFSKDAFMAKAIEIQKASEMNVDFEKELKNLVSRGALTKPDREEVETLIMNNKPEDGVTGGPSLWKLTQAITAHARTADPVRAREMHEISGELLNRVK